MSFAYCEVCLLPIHCIFYLFVVTCSRATTHTDFILRAAEKGIPYKVIHNASIMNAVGCCGLQVK